MKYQTRSWEILRLGFLCLTLAGVGVVGCAEARKLAREGESCGTTSDCAGDLRCLGNICKPEGDDGVVPASRNAQERLPRPVSKEKPASTPNHESDKVRGPSEGRAPSSGEHRPIPSPIKLEGPNECANSIAVSPDGTLLAIGLTNSDIILWDVPKQVAVRRLVGHKESITEVAFSPDGLTLASASFDGTFRFWSSKSGAELARSDPQGGMIADIKYAPVGSLCGLASSNGTALIWNGATGETVKVFKGQGPLTRLAFSRDAQQIAIGSALGSVTVLSLESGEELGPPLKFDKPVRGLQFSPVASQLAISTAGKDIVIWDTVLWKKVCTLSGHTDMVVDVGFLPSGTELISGSWDGTVRLWSLTEKRETLRMEGHMGPVYSVTTSPDGNTLFSSSDDRSIRLWDSHTGQETIRIEGCAALTSPEEAQPDQRPLRPLVSAASRGEWEEVQDRLARGENDLVIESIPNRFWGESEPCAPRDEVNALWYALDAGQWELAHELLRAGTRVDIGHENQSPLTMAANASRWPLVKEILEQRPLLGQRQTGRTALEAAIKAGKKELVSIMHSAGVSVHSRKDDRPSDAPLVWAALTGTEHIVLLLLELSYPEDAAVLNCAFGFAIGSEVSPKVLLQFIRKGADVNEASQCTGKTPMELAHTPKKAYIEEMLRANGAR